MMQNFQLFMKLPNMMAEPTMRWMRRTWRPRWTRSRKSQTNDTQLLWTHGACGHNGHQCRYPAVGHQVSATFENKMNVSIANCSMQQNQSMRQGGIVGDKLKQIILNAFCKSSTVIPPTQSNLKSNLFVEVKADSGVTSHSYFKPSDMSILNNITLKLKVANPNGAYLTSLRSGHL